MLYNERVRELLSMDYICGVTDVKGRFQQEREKR